jgi:phage-related protein
MVENIRHFDYASDAAERAYRDLPTGVIDDFGHEFWLIQKGEWPPQAKPLHGFSVRVSELREDDESGTYRAVFTVEFPGALYILHAFQKKSKKGIATDKKDLELIAKRVKEAEMKYRAWLREEEGKP